MVDDTEMVDRVAQALHDARNNSAEWDADYMAAARDGYRELARAAIAAGSMAAGWRPTYSYRPGIDPETVLIAGEYPNGLPFVEETYWRKDVNKWSGRWLDWVTHWMPLPPPPKDTIPAQNSAAPNMATK